MNPLPGRQSFLWSSIIWFGIFPLHGQFLLLDRALKNPAPTALGIGLNEKSGAAFLADRFRISEAGEVWVLDRLRTWGTVAGRAPLGDRFEKIMLFGGLEASLPVPGEVDCDCHNLVAVQTAAIEKGSDSAAGPDVRISRLNAAIWQVDFDHLNWSVPGGVEIQFGIAGVNRSGNAHTWSAYAVQTATPHQIRRFDSHGKLLGLPAVASDPNLGFAIQVWGHLPATIEILRRGELWVVTLKNGAADEAAQADRDGFRFGPKGARPVSVHSQGNDLVLNFPAAGAGIRAGELNACLTGKRHDGVPFEGCDLLKSAR
jgi:hypothetical protein